MKSQTLPWIVAFLIAVGCSAPSDDSHSATNQSSSALPDDSGKPYAVASSTPSESTEDSYDIPAEEFTDGATAFAHVRDQI